MCVPWIGVASSFARELTTIQEVRPIAKEPRVNDKIRAREVRLVDPDGGQIGIKSIEEARWLADQLDYDLVEVAPDARPPVVRLMDYGKYKYEESVKRREARKKQTKTVIKEVQFRPKIGEADFDVKLKRVIRFLGEGDKVKCTMRFRGREVTHPEIGFAILQRLAQTVEDLGEVELRPRLDGRQMTMVLAPTRRPEPKHAATPGDKVASGPVDAEAEASSNGSVQPESVIGDAASEEPAVDEARDEPVEDENPAAE